MSGCHSKLGGTADTYSSLSCLWQGFFIAFKEPRQKVAGEFKDIGADGAKARSTLLSKEGVMKQSFETSNCIMVFLFLSWVIRIRPMVIM